MDTTSELISKLRSIEEDLAKAQLQSEKAKRDEITSFIMKKRKEEEKQEEGAGTEREATVAKSRTLITVVASYEANRSLSYTFPTSVDVWGLLAACRRGAAGRAATATDGVAAAAAAAQLLVGAGGARLVMWMVLVSSHTTTPLVVHAEDLRSVMLREARPHCVVNADGAAVKSAKFWKLWNPRGELEEHAKRRIDGATAAPFSLKGPAVFPGELICPLSKGRNATLVSPASSVPANISHLDL